MDPSNVEFLCTHYRKVFAVFRAFVRKRCPGIVGDFDWPRLEEGIRNDPARFTEHDYFETLSSFFGIDPANEG
ncbi:MAG: hypothetical protein KA419_08450 [Acidobacteria bacterium]|nr:hypothetical protein [Acidobacteriota bacterium]